MGRAPRNSQGGYVYHAIGRGLKPKPIFRSEEDYQDFEAVLCEMVERFEPRVLSYCVLPKHWHLILVPRKDGDLSKLMAWLTITHSARWHAKPRRSGTGGLYERRFKAFPVQDDLSLLELIRFVESHPKRTGSINADVETWRWSSGFMRGNGSGQSKVPISSSPIALPTDWLAQINQAQPEEILLRIENAIARSCPYGDPLWVAKTAKRLGLESTVRPRGRPKKA